MAYQRAKACAGHACRTCDDQSRTHKLSTEAVTAIALFGMGMGGASVLPNLVLEKILGSGWWVFILAGVLYISLSIAGIIYLKKLHRAGRQWERRKTREEGGSQ